MKIALCSDLHLEFEDIDLKNTDGAEVLILSGDIMLAADLHSHPPTVPNLYAELSKRQITAKRFRDFLNRVSAEFPHVVYIAGNHEFYHGKWNASLEHLRTECTRYPNVHFLERDIKVIDEVSFIGATLWTDCNRNDRLTVLTLNGVMNDYRVIRNDEHEYSRLHPDSTIQRHHQTMSYLKAVLPDLKDKKVVFVGHHGPSAKSTHPKYQYETHMNGGYRSDLDEFIMDHPQIVLWTHGHMHDPFDYMIGTTRVVCTPRGYKGHDPQADMFELKFLDI
jgi:DNA repair exonuclease SbcCD nuclease subunit